MVIVISQIDSLGVNSDCPDDYSSPVKDSGSVSEWLSIQLETLKKCGFRRQQKLPMLIVMERAFGAASGSFFFMVNSLYKDFHTASLCCRMSPLIYIGVH